MSDQIVAFRSFVGENIHWRVLEPHIGSYGPPPDDADGPMPEYFRNELRIDATLSTLAACYLALAEQGHALDDPDEVHTKACLRWPNLHEWLGWKPNELHTDLRREWALGAARLLLSHRMQRQV